jgi:predicted PurR-regulated permease PerM
VSEEPSERPAARPSGRERLVATIAPFWRLWGLLIFVFALLVWFRGIVLPFVFATLVAYLLAPLVRAMAPKLGGRRGLAVVGLYLALAVLTLGFFGGVVPAVVSDLSTLRESTPSAVERLNQEWLPRASEWFERTFPGLLGAAPEPEAEQISELIVVPQTDGSYRVDLRGAHLEVRESGGGWVIEAQPKHKQTFAELIREVVASKGDELTALATEAVRAVVTGIASFLTDLLITFLIAAFILVDLDRVQRFIRSLVPPEYRSDFDAIVRGVDEGMAGVIRGQLLICLINGALAYVGLLVFGVRYALLLAMVAAVLSVIPVFGILISAIPLLGVALVSGDVGLEGLAFGRAAWIVGWIVGIHLLESSYLNPRVIGTADIHPVVLVFALLAGWEVYGPIGAVLALPVASMIQTVFSFARKRASQQQARASGVWTRPEGMAGRSATKPGAASPEQPDPADSGAIRLDTARYRALQATPEGSRPSPAGPPDAPAGSESPSESASESQTRSAGAPVPDPRSPDASDEPGEDEPPPGAS